MQVNSPGKANKCLFALTTKTRSADPKIMPPTQSIRHNFLWTWFFSGIFSGPSCLWVEEKMKKGAMGNEIIFLRKIKRKVIMRLRFTNRNNGK